MKFIGTLEKFNCGKQYDNSFKQRIYLHFEYIWMNDKNQVFLDDQYLFD